MNRPIQLLIHGASGRMGQSLLRLAIEREDVVIAGAVAPGASVSEIRHASFFPVESLEQAPLADAVVDFSLPQGFDRILMFCEQRGMALVSGTTGLDSSQHDAIAAAARRIPVLWSANFSLGVAMLSDLVERAAAALQDWDCDIVEAHHTRKLDAPSGTALALGAAVQRGGAQPRYASLRAGDIVGEHLVQFSGMGERLELIHRATNRDIFARGALHAAVRLAGRAPGVYTLRDLLFDDPPASGR